MMFFFERRREFIVEEKDVTTILSVVGHEANVINYNIGRCGWQDHPNKWFISFYASDRKYGKIMRCLTEIGEFKVNTRPNGQVDLWFEEN